MKSMTMTVLLFIAQALGATASIAATTSYECQFKGTKDVVQVAVNADNTASIVVTEDGTKSDPATITGIHEAKSALGADTLADLVSITGVDANAIATVDVYLNYYGGGFPMGIIVLKDSSGKLLGRAGMATGVYACQ